MRSRANGELEERLPLKLGKEQGEQLFYPAVGTFHHKSKYMLSGHFPLF